MPADIGDTTLTQRGDRGGDRAQQLRARPGEKDYTAGAQDVEVTLEGFGRVEKIR